MERERTWIFLKENYKFQNCIVLPNQPIEINWLLSLIIFFYSILFIRISFCSLLIYKMEALDIVYFIFNTSWKGKD